MSFLDPPCTFVTPLSSPPLLKRRTDENDDYAFLDEDEEMDDEDVMGERESFLSCLS